MFSLSLSLSVCVCVYGLDNRTHNGVLKLANWVVNALLKRFPGTIDKLDPEYARPHIYICLSSSLISLALMHSLVVSRLSIVFYECT